MVAPPARDKRRASVTATVRNGGNRSLGRVVRYYRRQAERRQQDVATAAGVSREEITAIENGRIHHIKQHVLTAIQRYLEIPGAELAESVGVLVGEQDAFLDRRAAEIEEELRANLPALAYRLAQRGRAER
jgi:transcriptional regulator with XRE-family HTH domain